MDNFDPDGGVKKGPITTIMHGTNGKSTYWAANQEAPLTRDQQIELMKNAKSRQT